MGITRQRDSSKKADQVRARVLQRDSVSFTWVYAQEKINASKPVVGATSFSETCDQVEFLSRSRG